MSPSVRVVVVDYDGADALPRCLASLSGTIGPDIPVTIIDNASPTPSQSLVPPDLKDRVNVIRNTENSGYAGAIAQAWNLTDEDFLAITNNDLEFTPRWLDSLLDTAASRNAHAVSAVIHHENESTVSQTTNASLNPLFYLVPGVFSDRTVAVYPSGACFLLRKDPDIPAPPVDPSYFLYYEDVYIGFLLKALGKNVVQAPDAHVRHIGSHSVRKSNPNRIAFLQERNRLVTQALFMDCPRLIWISPGNFLDFFVKPFTCWFRKKPYWATIAANWWILFHWFHLRKKHVELRKIPGFDTSRNYPYLTGRILPDTSPLSGLLNGISRFWYKLGGLPVDGKAEESGK